jgi:predicted membrane protein
MENDDIKKYKEDVEDDIKNRHHGHGHMWGGLILVAAGGLLLARKLGAYIPDWLLSWPMLLIACGLLIGFKSNFRNAGGFIMILVGCAFLLGDLIPTLDLRDFIWPGILIIIGISFILKPRVRIPHKRHWRRWEEYKTQNFNQPEYTSAEYASPEVKDSSEFIEINAVFGGVKKIVLSKNFRGGEINTFMGGAEINLQQADIKQAVSLEVNNVFGGTKIIIPSNWDIKNEVTAVFGGVEDKRSINLPTPDVTKSIILRGTCVFGGIEIKNF